MRCITRPKLISLEKLSSLLIGAVRKMENLAATQSKVVGCYSIHGRKVRTSLDEIGIIECLRFCKCEFQFINLVHLRKHLEITMKKPITNVMLKHR